MLMSGDHQMSFAGLIRTSQWITTYISMVQGHSNTGLIQTRSHYLVN